MSLSEADIAFATDLFGALPNLTNRKMFGGLGIYSDGVIFALMMSDARLMLKAQDADFETRLRDMGSEKWTYRRKDGKAASMPYWTLPDPALDDPDLALDLARTALALQRT